MEKGIIAEVYSLDGEDSCFAGNDHFTKFLGVSAGRVSRRVSILVAKGVLVRDLRWTSRGRKRTLSVAPGIIDPIVGNDNTPIVENDDSQLPFSTSPIVGNDSCYKDDNTMKEQGEGASAEPPPTFAPPAFKKDSPEEVSWAKFQIAKDQLDTYLPIDFFEFLEKEVIGQWDKIPWTVALVNNWQRQVWVKFGYEIASQAVSDLSAEVGGWKVSIAKVVEKCNAVRRKQIEGKQSAENIERMKKEAEELKKNGGRVGLGYSKMTVTELEAELRRIVQDEKWFLRGLIEKELKKRVDSVEVVG